MTKGEQLLSHGLLEKIRAIQSRPEAASPAPAGKIGAAALAKMIDHTLLKADATKDQIVALCQQAYEYSFASVCVNPSNAALCHDLLKKTDVKVCSVIGFPLGATLSEVKAYEAERTIAAGAAEIDMVINIGALKTKDYELVHRDIAAVAQVCHANAAILKVIIETALLTDEEKIAACLLAQEAAADFVKTSTGFGPSGAKAEDVSLMRRAIGPKMGIKAAGGIHSYQDAMTMIRAGATRIGASAGVKIVQEARTEESR